MDDLGEMRVLAAAFADVRSAIAAEAELRQKLDVEGPDIKVAEASRASARAGFAALLAGRFRNGRRRLVEEIVRRHHGRIVEDRPEAHVRPLASRWGPT